MHEPRWLLFASDATLVALWGVALLVLAAVALVAERRRMRRARIEQVGCMPWTAIFLAAAIGGVALITLAVQGWARG